LQRVLCAPLAAHAAALALLLLLLMPVVGTTSQFFSDEGAALAQVAQLEHGHGWTMPNSFPAADPEGAAFPISLSAQSGDEFAPFAKHPLYPVMLVGADSVGGRAGIVVLSILGTVVAALLSALLARPLDPRLAVPAFWALGVASPMFFDSYMVVAHTLAAACAAGAALLLLRQLTERRSWMAVISAAALLLIGMMLRNEMVFMGLAFAATIAVVGIRRKSGRTMLLSAVPAAAVIGGMALDRLLQGIILHGGGATGTAGAGESGGLLSGRIAGFTNTWLLPADASDGRALLVFATVVLAAVAVVFARRTPPDRDGVRLFVVLAAVAAVARLAFEGAAVPGLLAAFPLLVAGLAALNKDTFAGAPARFLGATCGLFSAGVLATQYATGGGAEWGGRYFAIGLPLIVPVVLLALRNLGRRLDRTTARIGLASALAVSAAFSVLAIMTLRVEHEQTDRIVAAVDAAAERVSATDGGAPVVLTTNRGLGRFDFPLVDRTRWLTVSSEQLTEYGERVRDLGVGPVTFVTRNASGDLAKLDGLFTTRDETEPLGGWTIVTLEPCVGPNACSPTR